MAKKFDAKELTHALRLHAQKALAVGMQAGLTAMIARLDRGESVDGSAVKAYSDNYNKAESRRRALGRINNKATKKSGQKKTKEPAGAVDWRLTGAMRRGMTILPPKRINSGWEAVYTVLGRHYSGNSKSDILRWNIEKRPNLWGLSKDNFQTLIRALKDYLKSVSI